MVYSIDFFCYFEREMKIISVSTSYDFNVPTIFRQASLPHMNYYQNVFDGERTFIQNRYKLMKSKKKITIFKR